LTTKIKIEGERRICNKTMGPWIAAGHCQEDESGKKDQGISGKGIQWF
jgi:hypothetical protein